MGLVSRGTRLVGFDLARFDLLVWLDGLTRAGWAKNEAF